MRIRALAVRQPFANLIASGRKTIEVRSWATDYRGPVLIVASQTIKAAFRDLAPVEPRGAAICIVDLVDVREGRRSDERAAFCDPSGDFAWILERPRKVPPRPELGKLNLYHIEVPEGWLRR